MMIWFAWLVKPTIETTLRDTHVTILEAGLTLKNLREASEEWKQASKDQASATTQAMYDVSAAANKLTIFVSRTDDSVNSKIIPKLSMALEQQNSALLQSQSDLQANLAQMLQATQQLQQTLSDADAVIADPKIKESLDHLATATENASEAMHHVSGITEAGENTARYYEHRLTSPQSFFKTLLEAMLQLGSQARILFNK
jgi:hypothetical protein